MPESYGPDREVLNEALDLFHQQGKEAKASPSGPICLWVAQAVGDEHCLDEAARAWLAKELLVEAIVRETLKGLYTEGASTPEALEELLQTKINLVGATIPAALKDAMFVWMLKEQCAALLHAVHRGIQARVESRRGS